eukprot:gene23484-biopygen8869
MAGAVALLAAPEGTHPQADGKGAGPALPRSAVVRGVSKATYGRAPRRAHLKHDGVGGGLRRLMRAGTLMGWGGGGAPGDAPSHHAQGWIYSINNMGTGWGVPQIRSDGKGRSGVLGI